MNMPKFEEYPYEYDIYIYVAFIYKKCLMQEKLESLTLPNAESGGNVSQGV